MDEQYRIYHLNIDPNSQEIIDYIKKFYDKHEIDHEETYPYLIMAEFHNLVWPGHEVTMKDISLRFQNVEFHLESQGPHFHDIWKKVFLNGEMKVYQGRVWYEL
jgi:hypothetical protein